MDLDRYVRNKWETLFKYMNHSGTGIFTMEELMEFPTQLLKAGKVELGITIRWMDLERYVRNKWETLFKYMNHSGTGVFTMGELMEFPTQLLKAGKVELGITLAKAYKGHWDRVLRVGSLDPDSQMIGQEDWVKGQSVISQDKAYYTEFIHAVAVAFVEIMDKNRDGVINRAEWRMYYKSQGIHNEEFIQTTFAKMDADGNGYIDTDEFVKAMKAYNFTHMPGKDFSFLYNLNDA